jgi:hypothetical protein
MANNSDGRALYHSVSARLQAPLTAPGVGGLAADTLALCTTWRHLFAQAPGGALRVAAAVLSKVRRDVPAEAQAFAKELAAMPSDASLGQALLLVELLQVALMGGAFDDTHVETLARRLAHCLAGLPSGDEVASTATRAVLLLLTGLRVLVKDVASLHTRWAACDRCWTMLRPYTPCVPSDALQLATIDGVWGAVRSALTAAWEATAPARHAAGAASERSGPSPVELLQRDQRGGYTAPLDPAWSASVFVLPAPREVPWTVWACASAAMRLAADDQSGLPIRTPAAAGRRREMLLALRPLICMCVRAAVVHGSSAPAAELTAMWGLLLELETADTFQDWAMAAARFRLLQILTRRCGIVSCDARPSPSLKAMYPPAAVADTLGPVFEALASDTPCPLQLITTAVNAHVGVTTTASDLISLARGAAAWLPLCLTALAILRRNAQADTPPDERLGAVCCVLCRSVALKGGPQATGFCLPSDPLIVVAFCIVAGAAVEAAVSAGDLLAARRLMFLPATVVTAAMVPPLLHRAEAVVSLWHRRNLPLMLYPPTQPHSQPQPYRVWYEPRGALPDPGLRFERCRILAYGPADLNDCAGLLARTVVVSFSAPVGAPEGTHELWVRRYDAQGGCAVAAVPWTAQLNEGLSALRGGVAAAAQHVMASLTDRSRSSSGEDERREWWEQRLRHDVALGVALRRIEMALGPALFLLPGRAACDHGGSGQVWDNWVCSSGVSFAAPVADAGNPMVSTLVHALRSIPDVVSEWRRNPDASDLTLDALPLATRRATDAILPLLQAVIPTASVESAASLVAATLRAWPISAIAPTTSFVSKFAPGAAAAPFLLVTDEATRIVPWEHTCIARPAMCTRAPSLAHAARTAQAYSSASVDGRYCTVDPEEQLAKTRSRLGPVLSAQKWAGTVGRATVDGAPAVPPREWAEEPGFNAAAVVLYAGHNEPEGLLGRLTLLRVAQETAYVAAGRSGKWGIGAGRAVAVRKRILALGCSSAAPREAALHAGDTLACSADAALCYGGADSYVGFAWDGTDGEFDRVAVATLQLAEQHRDYCVALLRCARGSCKLKRLTGAAVVAYGRCD